MKRLRDSIQTRLTFLGVALSALALVSIALIDSYYRATYRDETAAQLIAYSVATFRTSITQIDTGAPITLSQPKEVLGPLYSVAAPSASVEWPRPYLLAGVSKILKEPVRNFETRYVPFSDRPLWVSFPAAGKTYWIALPIGVEGRPRPWVLLVGATVVLALTAGFGSYVLVVRPVRRLGETVKSGRPRLVQSHAITPHKPEPTEIEEVLSAFEALLERLTKQEQERDLSLAAISHDLRAPLARLRMRLETQNNAALRAASIGDIGDIDRVLSQFLAYVRGNYSGEPDTALVNIFEELQQRYLEHDVIFTIPVALKQQFPREAISRILTNLIDNALIYGKAPADISARLTNGHIEIRITDQGSGFSQSQVETALAPFSQLNPARTASGSGLGLAIVARLVAALNGDIKFEQSEKGFSAIVVL